MNAVAFLEKLPFIPPLARGLGRVVKFKQGVSVRLAGYEITAKSLDRLLALYLYKFSLLGKFQTRLFKEIIRPGMTIVDVGANIGYYTLLFARQAGPEGRVFSFEPEPAQRAVLLENLDRNGVKNVFVSSSALADRIGCASLWLNEANQGDHRIYDPGDGRRRIEIETTTLDRFLKEKGCEKVDLVKIDVQGAEPRVIQGMKETIQRNPRIILFCELWPQGLKEAGESAALFLESLKVLGFKIQVVDEKKERLALLSKSQLLELCAREGYVDLLAFQDDKDSKGAPFSHKI
ncbi:MAG: FkbM family methyltransferase [Candidatus Omnitrophica bacterium]|nr:FkbM family methyltransferase [Candidatus Omnitrophota bacterium]